MDGAILLDPYGRSYHFSLCITKFEFFENVSATVPRFDTVSLICITVDHGVTWIVSSDRPVTKTSSLYIA
jgi:hypothetical protein